MQTRTRTHINLCTTHLSPDIPVELVSEGVEVKEKRKHLQGGGERVDDILPSKIAGSTWREGRMEDVSLKGKH